MTARAGLEVLCLGETMSLIAPAESVGLETATSFTLTTGGAESNVAVHLAALGHRVAWAGRVGADPLGRRLVATIGAAGVDTSLVETHPTAPTGVYFKDPAPGGTTVYYYRAGSAASTMDEWFLDGAGDAELLHISGITPALSPGCDRLITHLLAGPRRSRISFDVNYRPALWSAGAAGPRLRELAQLADIVFVGLDEAGTLWGAKTADDVRAVLDGPATLVVKDAANDATAFGAQPAVVTAPEVRVVEPVGAGDAFAAGYLSGVLRGESAVRCLRLGHLLAAHSLLSTEDHTPLPTADVLAGWLDCDESTWNALRFGGSR
ncbi:2-dehydro-3-deoxygluconokinase [Saccharopolyspora erythraea NRRL 2338]|uniref:2-keto-3-deoxygluconate kinase n=2 Tax=Saccharopolyspora erythraea TaxID=1836 RepID=A4FM81_SACEN|nr:sugar kinase [Saccharopolyspora erythraea]EQD87747.1 carbohydrate kinase [Saccharopolyspora erythraea D]PFG98793.1 2-dehydro-3-deoxygluconokinase [Saccharopolyspora erythraea NRRL 2338]CAM05156.1 2-keto-3-deoxygluconate kinase [Saccharopolyspora erythraea NRRL 2338]